MGLLMRAWRMPLLFVAAAVGSVLVTATAVPDQVDPKAELSALRHAQDDIGTLQEADEARFNAAKDEIDRLVQRKHRLSGPDSLVAQEVTALQHEATTMTGEASVAAKMKDKADLAKKAESEAAALRGAASLLQGGSNDLKEVTAAIERATAEGKAIDARIQGRKEIRAGLDLRIKQLERAEERAEEDKQSANDFDSFKHKADLTDADVTSDDEEDSASALEKALGWNRNELEENANAAKDALSHGLGGARKVGGAMGALLR